MKHSWTLVLLAHLLPLFLRAQCKDNVYDYLDVNKVRARYQNGGNFHFDMVGSSTYEVPVGMGVNSNFAGSLWVGGLDPQGGLHVAASTYRQNGWEWYTGPARPQNSYNCPTTIETNSDIFLNGLKPLSTGKVLILTETEAIVFDPVTRQSIVRPWGSPRTWVDAVELNDGRILLFGDDTYPNKNSVLFMDTINYNLTGGPTLNWFHKESSATILVNGKVFFAGVVGCEVYDPTSNISSVVPDMLYPRQKHAALRIDNGDVLIVGGGAGLGGTGLTQVTQIFEDSLGTWSPGPALNMGRQRARIVQLADGKTFIYGGNVTQTGTQMYDPGTGMLSPGPNLPFAVLESNAFVLDSEWVLIAASNTGPSIGGLFRFNVYTGAYSDYKIQRSGARAFLLNYPQIGIQTEDLRHVQYMNLVTREQDDDQWQSIFKVSRAEIDAFRADFQAGTVDFSDYPSIATWPAHGDENMGEDRNLAPFIDLDNDGRYDPAGDGDYPCIVGDQALWWVMNDLGPHLESNGKQLGIQVEVMAYAVDCQSSSCPDSSLDYATFLHFEITNRSDTSYHEVYIGNHEDCDLGSWQDDFVACDSSLGLAIAFNGASSDAGYGLAPPSMGMALLPNGDVNNMSGFLYFENNFNSPIGQPTTPQHFYNLMRSLWLDSTHVINNGQDGHVQSGSGSPINYMFPSTDIYCNGTPGGWSEVGANRQPYDRRYLQSFGPFNLPAQGRLKLDLALIWERDSSNYASLCQLKTTTVAVQNWWANVLDHSCFDLVVGREEAKPDVLGLQVYPNPSDGMVWVSWEQALGGKVALSITDLQGRIMEKVVVEDASKASLDLTGLAAGMYIVQAVGEGGKRTERLVIQ